MEEKNFIKGFNHGYILSSQQPELLKTLIAGTQDASPYVEGLKEGSLQREQEIMREKIKGSIHRDKNQERGNDRER